jgi:hypothetical protein
MNRAFTNPRKRQETPRLELSAHAPRHTCLTGLVRRGTDLVTAAERG